MIKKSLIVILMFYFPTFFSFTVSPDGKKDEYNARRIAMVEDQIISRGVNDPAVLDAMRRVARHLFVPAEEIDYAYSDHPLPIGHNQTISQPYIVALMSELAKPTSKSKILEVGTGSGYQAAVLAEIVESVYTIEIIDPLSKSADKLLKKLGYKNIHCKVGDGYYGWKEQAPFDAIIVTAAPSVAPDPLLAQLKIDGRLIIPVGEVWQELVVITKTKKGYERKSVIPVRFVPMTGEAEKKKR
jgi:protein-L-isoaspartate(D-aspartate) O-methyltransferase